MSFLFALALSSAAAEEGPPPARGQTVELVHEVEPRFPREARRQRVVHAECAVLVRVTPEGVPDDLHVTSCDPLFVDPTLAALGRWRFRVTPPSVAQFRVVVRYDYPKKEGSHVVVESPGGSPEAPTAEEPETEAPTAEEPAEAPTAEEPAPEPTP